VKDRLEDGNIWAYSNYRVSIIIIIIIIIFANGYCKIALTNIDFKQTKIIVNKLLQSNLVIRINYRLEVRDVIIITLFLFTPLLCIRLIIKANN